MMTRVAPLLAVSATALVLATVMVTRGSETAAESATSRPAAAAPLPPVVAPPPARGAKAVATRPLPHVTLPVDSPWALPPMLVLQARTGGKASAALRRRVLHLKNLALSPAARRSVRRGVASAGALRLLAAFPRTGGPLLVLALDGRRIRAQETTLWMTRTALRAFRPCPRSCARSGCCSSPSRPIASTSPARRAPRPGQLRTLVTIYRNAGYQYGIDWRVLAAINRVETNLGRNTHVSSAGAVGWMQFLPSTWRRWGVDASGDGIADPYDPQDAIFSAARYLDAAGARKDLRRAIFAYNHANWYVNEVLSIAASLPDNYGD